MFAIAALSLSMTAGMAGPCSSSQSYTGCSDKNEGTTMVSTVNWSPEKDLIDTAVAAGSFNTLAAALKAADLIDALKGDGPFTVFAPTDAAFAALPAGTVESLLKPENKSKLQAILLYHVVPGELDAAHVLGTTNLTTLNGQRADIGKKWGDAKIDGAKIIKTDIHTSNGIIHVIDAVILPETKTIPQVAESAGSFGTLLAAVKTAGLADTLMGEGPFTVFAPTDEAFSELGGTVNELLKPENRQKLTDILTYHVVPGRVYADQVVKLHEAKTVNGGKVDIHVNKGTVTIDKATVIQTDIEASNGVIHVIDGVLLP
ncbi:MAG: fasciclin domain-containing protein [Phycisphaerales bacterium]